MDTVLADPKKANEKKLFDEILKTIYSPVQNWGNNRKFVFKDEDMAKAVSLSLVNLMKTHKEDDVFNACKYLVETGLKGYLQGLVNRNHYEYDLPHYMQHAAKIDSSSRIVI